MSLRNVFLRDWREYDCVGRTLMSELAPEQRIKIYEEEKARIEAPKKIKAYRPAKEKTDS